MDEEISNRLSDFWDSAHRASAEVTAWPEWMRNGSMIQRKDEKMADEAKSKGTKHDQDKPRLELLPPSYWRRGGHVLSCEMAHWFFYGGASPQVCYDPEPVLRFGATKYADHNWVKGMEWSRLVGAFHRHCNKLDSGLWVARDLDEPDLESGLPHGAHAACCALFLREYETAGLGIDDRPCAEQKL